MPASFDIRSASKSYRVVSSRHVFATHAAVMSQAVVIADRYFAASLASGGIKSIALDADETTKSFHSIGDIIVSMRDAGATRTTHLWAIGGGAIQDAAAFVASIYMRGIDWTYVPTTLLAMVDSCIGGKSSINVGDYKNIVGTFYPPSAVLIDPHLTATLTTEQRVAGLCEAAKICYCRGVDRYREYLALQPHADLGPDAFESIIELSLSAKKWFIEIDEFDRNERLTLNFGHTFGHALEAATGFRLNHGLAVGVGVLCALAFARVQTGVCDDHTQALEAHMRALLQAGTGAAEALATLDHALFERAFLADKKHERDVLKLVLPVAGQALPLARVAFPRDGQTMQKVGDALHAVRGSLGA
jgi:3-dehydroquinate synthase